ncbi:sigma-54-dependent transcriptional regulator [Chryseolinea lacunae]|uniref:Sigma-54-dependent Fis family transcriptional regulator n=1 Tax=Chryseolinea lacunae TaxID=2801331 RepID=A0ABS1L075_9BACT|nr:sigma-54 dependent transcriptional regulator [Chryseolinea lacunae]MBL0745110.1 sigma-54-dependent Fis family transcriptional regulator [Chryseolinea lacunae]
MPKLLIIDDDKDICLVLSKFLTKNNYEVDVAYKGEEGLKLLRASRYNLVLCDYRLPDHTGVEMLRKIKLLQPDVAVVIITGYSDVRTAVETFRYGANDYVTKPLYPDELLVTIKETIAKNEKRNTSNAENADAVQDVRKGKSTVNGGTFIVGKSIQSQTVQKYIELIAPSDMSVIINGETGTGKEFVAQSVHKFSKRSDKPFVAIDCGALPKELAGSELFGHVKGAFTGAVSDKQGSFEVADTGTIFLDEIGNLSYENQVKLLRVIQERRIKRIGATRDIPIDVRIIAATNEDLIKAVKEGRFREDLYHRLNEFKIQLSPLRERKEDIIIFANYFLEKSNQALQKNVKSFSPDVVDQLTNYFWHGNLRELNNVIKRSVLLTIGESVQADSLPQEIIQANNTVAATGALVEDSVGLLKSIAGSAERQAIIDVLEKVNYNKSKAAELLRIDRKTLYNKLKLYSISA